jgi:pyruvate carboxylase
MNGPKNPGRSVQGVETNIEFLRKTLSHAAFQTGQLRTNLIDTHRAELI